MFPNTILYENIQKDGIISMNEKSRLDKINHRIKNAESTLLEANAIKDLGYLNAALNRYYYACFYAVSALLLSKDIKPKNTCRSKIIYFHLHFVQTRIVPLESRPVLLINYLTNSQSSDYEDFIDIDKETIENFSTIVN